MGSMFVEPTRTMQYRTTFGRDQVSTVPRHAGRPHRAPPAKVPEGQFDPDELTRRLYMVLAEQKAHAERRQRARGELSNRKDGLGSTRHRNGNKADREARPRPAKLPTDLITDLKRSGSAKHKPSTKEGAATASEDSASQPRPYHHVPHEAAKQFTRTTTVENMRNNIDLVHKLSKRALKFHTEGSRAVRRGSGGGGETNLAPAELSRALQQSQSQRDKLLERNQFQRTRILEEAARLDHDQQHHHHAVQSPAHKHTLENELTRILTPTTQQTKHTRRNSTGNTDSFPHHDDTLNNNHHHHHHHNRRSLILSTEQYPHPLTMDPLLEEENTTLSRTATATAGEDPSLHRFPPADRARVDWTQSDESRRPGGPKMLLLSPLLRKADSLWTLRGRRGSKESVGVGAAGSAGGGDGGESPTKAGRGGFFGRFKR